MIALRQMAKESQECRVWPEQAKLNATTLYRPLSPQGKTELKSLTVLLKAMGMRVAVQPLGKGPLSDQVAEAPDACGQSRQLGRLEPTDRRRASGRFRRRPRRPALSWRRDGFHPFRPLAASVAEGSFGS